MRWFHRWLLREPDTFVKTVAFLMLVYAIDYTFAYVIYPTGFLLDIANALNVPTAADVRTPLFDRMTNFQFRLHAWILVPFLEEATYRAVPLVFAVWNIKRTRFVGVLVMAVVSALFFARSHIGWGWEYAPYYTITAIGSSIVFLKCGGTNGKILKPFAACLVLHMVWNIL
jgi:hypothetical protein